jgi:hypothetical protein
VFMDCRCSGLMPGINAMVQFYASLKMLQNRLQMICPWQGFSGKDRSLQVEWG